MTVRKLTDREVIVRRALMEIEQMAKGLARREVTIPIVIRKKGLGKRYRSQGRIITVNFNGVTYRKKGWRPHSEDWGECPHEDDDLFSSLHNYGWGINRD